MFSVVPFFRPVLAALRPINRLLRQMPVIDDFEEQLTAKYLAQVVVRRIVNPKDRDLHAALELYEKRLPDDLRFQPADIIRWLGEDRAIAGVDSSLPRDYFLVAKHKRKVRAFVLFHYYPQRKIAFLAYMVVDRNTAGLGIDDLSRALVSRIAALMARDKLLKRCQALVFEVEDPRRTPRAKQLRDIARIQRFCALAATEGFTLRAYDFEYLQPPLALPQSNTIAEQPLLLVSARTRSGHNREDLRSELLEILEFIYTDLYPQGFSDLPEEQKAYQALCQSLHSKIATTVPSEVRIINPIHLTCGRPVRRNSVTHQDRA